VSLPTTQPHAPGWYPDPAGAGTRWWDGQQWTGRRAVARKARKLPPLGPRFARLSDLLCRMLLANVGLSALTLVVGRVVHRDAVLQLLAVAAMLLLVVTGVVWCAWQWRMAVSAPDRLRRRPRLHVGAWFIPVANLWLPLANMNELWHAYEPPDAQGRGRGIDLVVPWWTCWLVSAALGGVGLRTLLLGEAPDTYLGVAWALAAALAWFVVRRLSWRALLYHAGRE
jgi:uncharacterized protein DUF4328/uncharacterized protein DUF2510